MVALAVRIFCILGTVRLCVRKAWGMIVFISEDILCLVHREVVRIAVHMCGRVYVSGL